MEMEAFLIYLSGSLCLFLVSFLIKSFNNLWWTPVRIQSMLRSQGIKGPSYRFLHGNNKEITDMITKNINSHMELSHQVHLQVQPHIYSWTKLYGNIFFYWYGNLAHLVVNEVELIKEVFNNKEGAFVKTDADEYVRKLLGDGIVTTEGKKWFKLRKLSNHAFHAESLKGMIPAMIESVETMLERWRQYEDKEVEVFKEIKVLTSEIISRTAFGSSYLEGQDIFDMLTRMALLLSNNFYKARLPGLRKIMRTADDIESDKLEQGIQNSIMKMMRKREEAAKMGEMDGYGSDFFGLLLQAHHDADKTNRLSVEDIVDECKTFFIAGQETTTSSLTWTVLLLAIHTDWQDKVRSEVLELFGNQNPNPDGITRLKIMSMVIYEALRLYAPVIQVPRKVKREVRLGKLIVPANVEIQVPVLAVHHNPEIWGQDADLFKPERFADGVAKATNNNSAAFLPFITGPRSCVGSNFAITETKIALSMILQRYKFTLSPTYIHNPFQVITLCPHNGLQVILQPL